MPSDGKMIEIARPDGATLPAYLATPESGDRAPAIVVIQEWWGLNEQIKATADRLAQAGYRALVPDLYRGKVAADEAEAEHLMTELNWGEACGEDIQGAVAFLRESSPKVGVLGFCMGGALTILAAVQIQELDAAVCFYGIPPADAADPAKIGAPFLAHFAVHDDWCTPAAVNGLEATLKAAEVGHTIFRYDAKHAFFNETRPEVYDQESADQAWQRTKDFLAAHLDAYAAS